MTTHPTLKPMQKQGDLMTGQTEAFALIGERAPDTMRLEAEKQAAANRATEARALADRQQLSLAPARRYTRPAAAVVYDRSDTDYEDACRDACGPGL